MARSYVRGRIDGVARRTILSAVSPYGPVGMADRVEVFVSARGHAGRVDAVAERMAQAVRAAIIAGGVQDDDSMGGVFVSPHGAEARRAVTLVLMREQPWREGVRRDLARKVGG